MKFLTTLHGNLSLPIFFPDATCGVVKGVDATDLLACQVEGLVINTYHLLLNDISQKIDQRGIHHLMNWPKPVITDSGGFQVMSLIHDHPEMGQISDQKIIFKAKNTGQVILTPEKSIQLQLRLKTDIAIVLDDCTRPSEALAKEGKLNISVNEQKKSVERTIAWAKRSKREFVELLASQRSSCEAKQQRRPLLFAVVQGGNDKQLRKYCAQELLKIGFDGYCFGGFPMENGQFLAEILDYTAKLLPDDQPKYALGVGRPENIVECFKMGYQIFDCVIPTREARHQKLFIFNDDPAKIDLNGQSFYSNINLRSARYEKDTQKVSNFCDCLACQKYSRAYLRYLFKIGDSLAIRLASIHNLRFYTLLMNRLKLAYRPKF